MAGVPREGVTFIEETDHLAVECEQLLDEGATVMQERHLESTQIVRHVGLTAFLKELSDKGGDRDYLARECSALHAWLEPHRGGNAWQNIKLGFVSEVIFSAQSADRAALVAKPPQRWMLTHRFCELLEDPVHSVLAGARLELLGIDEQVDVL